MSPFVTTTFCTAVVGATLAACVEFVANILTAGTYGLPPRYAAGSLGRVLLANMLVWVPVGLLIAHPSHVALKLAFFQRLFRVRETAHATLLAVIAAAVIAFADLPRGWRFLTVPLAGLVAVTVLFVVRYLADQSRLAGYRAFLRLATLACVLLTIVGWQFCRRLACVPFTALHDTARRSPSPEDTRSPNVLLIVLDTVRADHLSLYGYHRPTTPCLERVAAEARVFDHAMSPAVWTVPSHASIFTGLSVREHKATWDNRWLDDGFVTFAESFAGAGYETASFSNNVHLRATNLLQGVRDRVPMWSMTRLSATFLDKYQRWLGIAPLFGWNETDDGAAVTNLAIAHWLDSKRDPSRPFFILVNLMEAHVLYWPPKSYRSLFMDTRSVGRSYDLLAERRDLHTVITRELTLRSPEVLVARDRAILSDLYDAAIRYQDDRVAELLEALASRELLDTTIVVVTSDHGESLGEHGHWDHQWSVYDTLLHVPLLLRYPPLLPPSRVSATVLTSDLFPTLLEMCDIPVTPDGGRRWVNLAAGPSPFSDEPVVAEYLAPYRGALRWALRHVPGFDAAPFRRTYRAVIDDKNKFIVASDGGQELFDLLNDPNELAPLTNSDSGAALKLAQFLTEWLARIPEYTPQTAEPATDEEMLQKLRSLGYVSD